jgi:hypothetical protein
MDNFHEDEFDAVFDLFNACNGEFDSSGMLKKSKLQELTVEEKNILDVPRLTRLWHHIKDGCPECWSVIATISDARRAMAASSTGRRASVSANVAKTDAANASGDAEAANATGKMALSKLV